MFDDSPPYIAHGVIMSKMQFDPRTVARDIPGIFDVVFPQLTPGLVAHFNRNATYVETEPVDSSLIDSSRLQAAMLSELGFALAERKLIGGAEDWDVCLRSAVERQKRHYDAVIPDSLTDDDKAAASALAENLVAMIQKMTLDLGGVPRLAPRVPGFEWIATGVGDIAINSTLVEVKFGSRRFSSADYRQVVVYWLLNHLNSLEDASQNWVEFVLLNPKLGWSVRVKFGTFLNMISSGRTTVEMAQVFASLISTRCDKN